MKLTLEPTGSTSNTIESKKRGRKPKKENYFDVEEEVAVENFLLAESWHEKNKIYNDFLRKPIDKMISSIIRRYKLYRKGMEFEEIHTDTHSFLMTKIDKFKPSKNKKAYSYFGTICKNYLMGQIIKDQKDSNRKISYEDISSAIENRPDLIYYIDTDQIDASTVVNKFIDELKKYIENSNLNENERRLGFALIDLFENHKTIFVGNDNKKFNKNIILLSLREMTNMNTKEIRSAMKKFKKLYLLLMKSIKK
jgi:hypothetical protein